MVDNLLPRLWEVLLLLGSYESFVRKLVGWQIFQLVGLVLCKVVGSSVHRIIGLLLCYLVGLWIGGIVGFLDSGLAIGDLINWIVMGLID